MTASTSKLVLSKPTPAWFNGEKIDIFHQSPIAPDSNSIENATLTIRRSDKQPAFGICQWVKRPEDKHLTKVVRFPEGFSGVSTEYEDDTFEAVGTLIKEGARWVVETDLEKIERLRREDEVAKMKKGSLSISEFGNDHEAYMRSLLDADQKAGAMVTRGHGGY